MKLKPVFSALVLLVATFLGGQVSTGFAQGEGPRVESVFVASTRLVDGPGSLAIRTNGILHFDRYDITIPASHRVSGVSASFSVSEPTKIDTPGAFGRSVVASPVDGSTTREVMVYVPGYNTGFEESLIRAAQIGADLNVPANLVLFAWPSGNRLDRYAQDVQSAIDAETALADLLRTLARSRVSRIVLIGHSLGADLVMGALARLQASGSSVVFAKIGGIALLSPDIAVDHFRATMQQLHRDAPPVVVYLSKNDWALRLLSDITDKKVRLGSVIDPEELSDLRLSVVDVTQGGGVDLAGHFAVVTQPNVLAAINAQRHPDLIGFVNDLKRGVIAGASVTTHGRMTHILLQGL